MINKVVDGKSIDVVFAAVTLPGDIVLVGDIAGVAVVGGAIGDVGAVVVCGVYEVPRTVGASSGYAQGTKLYYDPATKLTTKTAGSLKIAGYAWSLAADADLTTDLRLIG